MQPDSHKTLHVKQQSLSSLRNACESQVWGKKANTMEVDCPDSTKIHAFMLIIVVFVTGVYQYSEINPLDPTPFLSVRPSCRAGGTLS